MHSDEIKFTLTTGQDLISIGVCDSSTYLQFKDPAAIVWNYSRDGCERYYCLLPQCKVLRDEVANRLQDALNENYAETTQQFYEALQPLLSLFQNGEYLLSINPFVDNLLIWDYSTIQGFEANAQSTSLHKRKLSTQIEFALTNITQSGNVDEVKDGYNKYLLDARKRNSGTKTLLDYTTFEVSFDLDEYDYEDYLMLYATQPQNSFKQDRIHFYEKKIKEGEYPIVLLFNTFFEPIRNGRTEHYVLDGHHKLLAYRNLNISPRFAVLTHLPQQVEFDIERISELLFPWQLQDLLDQWYDKEAIVSELLKNPDSKFHSLIKNGFVQDFYENGQLKNEATYYYDQLNGDWKEWHLNGNLKAEGNYCKGSQRGEFKNYYDSGKIKSIETYNEKGIRHGLFINYFENGIIESEMIFDCFRIKDGTWKSWFSNGILKSERTFLDNKTIESKTYNQSGELTRHEKIDENKRLSAIPTAADIEHDRVYSEELRRVSKQEFTTRNNKQTVQLVLTWLAFLLGLILLISRLLK